MPVPWPEERARRARVRPLGRCDIFQTSDGHNLIPERARGNYILEGMRVRFHDFTLDTERRELYRGGAPLNLRPKAFELLQILIANRPKAVAQEELYDRLWPNTFVEKTNLHKLMHQLREALDDQEHKIIRTVYGFGFSFAATAIDEEAKPPVTQWQVVIGDREFDLREGENIIGRERDVTVRIDAPSISRRHARPQHGNRSLIEYVGILPGVSYIINLV